MHGTEASTSAKRWSSFNAFERRPHAIGSLGSSMMASFAASKADSASPADRAATAASQALAAAVLLESLEPKHASRERSSTAFKKLSLIRGETRERGRVSSAQSVCHETTSASERARYSAHRHGEGRAVRYMYGCHDKRHGSFTVATEPCIWRSWPLPGVPPPRHQPQ